MRVRCCITCGRDTTSRTGICDRCCGARRKWFVRKDEDEEEDELDEFEMAQGFNGIRSKEDEQ